MKYSNPPSSPFTKVGNQKTLLSVVLQGRNDSYMGNFVWRLSKNINKQAKNIFDLGMEQHVEIVLVDWGSEILLSSVLTLTEEAKSLLQIIQVPPLIASKYNRDSSYSCVHAVNTGIRRAPGDYILFCDGDTYVPLETMKHLLEHINNGSVNGIPLNEVLLLGSRYHIPKSFQETNPAIDEIDRYIDQNLNILAHDKINVDKFMGTATAYLMSRELWFSCRGFDERLIYWGWFDIDLFYRMKPGYAIFNMEDLGMPFYHLEHYSDSLYRSLAQENPRKGNPMIYPSAFTPNDKNWGLASENIKTLSNYPIIFIHEGDCDYLEYTLKCAKVFNPRARVILLGDETNEKYKEPGIEHFFYKDFQGEKSVLFDSVFQPIAGKDHIREAWWINFVFKRWFHMFYFIKNQRITRFWTFDSDTLILCDPNLKTDKFKEYDFTEQCNGMCINGLINNPEIIEAYLDKINKLFQDETYLNRQREDFKVHTDYAFTEMRAYLEFKQNTPIKTLRLNTIIDDETFDDCICQQHDMEMEGGVKKLYFRDGGVYLKHLPSQRLIKANSLNMSWVPVSFIKRVYDVVSQEGSKSSQQPAGQEFAHGNKELPIHLFTIVLNGEPFIRHHIEVFKQLPFKWHWHIIEGVADLKHDTAWSLQYGAKITDDLHSNGLSNDGTTEYIDKIKGQFPENITVYRKPGGIFWDGKREMVNAPLVNINEECLLWQVDSDELWTIEQLCTARSLFITHPEKTAAYYYCIYFVGENLAITTRNTYGNHTSYEWLRTWRYLPGDGWQAHEPPKLSRHTEDGQWVDIAAINPFRHAETEDHSLVFHHFSYATEAQLFFKERYFGYSGAVDQWKLLQQQTSFPVLLRRFFRWVEDNALVDTADALNIKPMAWKDDNGHWHFRQHEVTAKEKDDADVTKLQGEPIVKKSISPQQNILWIRTDAIGDAVLSASMLPYIREKHPNARITVVCQKHTAELYEADPSVDDVIPFDKKLALDDRTYLRTLLKKIQDLTPDLALNSIYSPDPITDIITIGSVAKEKIGFEGDLSNIPADFRQNSKQQYTNLLKSSVSRKPELERHRDFLKGIGIHAPSLQPVIWLRPEDEQYADDFFRIRGLRPEKTIILFSCAQFVIKYYQHYGIALSKICKDNDFSVVAVGSDHERERNQYNLNAIGVRTVNLCGQTTIRQTAALVKRCRLAVGADSATAHIACAVGTPNVVVLGGGHFGRFLPYSPLTAVVCHPMQCYQCNWHCKFPRPYCIQNISPTSLSEAVQSMLKGVSDRPRVFFEGEALQNMPEEQSHWKWFGQYLDFMSVDLIPLEKGSPADAINTSQVETPKIRPSANQDERAVRNGGFIATTFKAGLCNKIYEWTILREISEHYGMTVLVDWDEVRDGTIILPDTRYYDVSTPQTDIAGSFIPIRTDMPGINSVDDLHLDKNKNYILICGWDYKRSLTDENKRIQEIRINKIHSERIDSFLKQYENQLLIGLHVRKGDYLPTDEFVALNTDKFYRLPDYWYLNIAEQISTAFPDAKFFLATDSTIREKKIFLEHLPVIAIQAGKEAFRQDVLELFTLSKLPAIICSSSSFSMFARDYGRKKVSIWPTTFNQDIGDEIQKLKELVSGSPGSTSPMPTMISTPKISVVTPSYNQGQYIEKTILSVSDQNYPNFEHIIIDGGSTDNTLEILKKYPHLKWVSEKDEGQADALNKGFRMADGDIIAWINSDDWYEPEAFTAVGRWFTENPDKNVVMGDCNLINRNGKVFYTADNYERGFGEMSRFWVTGSIPTQPAVFFRRSLLEELGYLDTSLHYAMDYDLWIRFAKKNRFYHIDRILANYRFHEAAKGGVQQDWGLFVPDCKKVFKRHVLSQRPPAVSVIIACYNQGSFLSEAVESVINQKYQDFEIIIVNDGSTDNTQQIAEMLVKKYSDNCIKVIHQENMGISAARNTSIKASGGRYILPLDADDMVHPDMLLRTVETLEAHPGIGIAYTDVQKFGKIDEYWESWDWDTARLYSQNILPYCSLYRREVWEAAGGYKERIIFGYEDWDYWVSCAEQGIVGKRVPENLLIYRVKDVSRDTEAIKHHDNLFAHIVISHPHLYKQETVDWANSILGTVPDTPLSQQEKPPVKVSAPVKMHGNPLRILLVVHSFPTQRMAGTELYTYNLAREFRERGHSVNILYPVVNQNSHAGTTTVEELEGVSITRLHLNPPLHIGEEFINEHAGNAFRRYLSENIFDIVHFHHFYGISATPLQVCSEMNIPSAVTLHDEWLLCEQLHYLLPDGSFCTGPETVEKCVKCLVSRHPDLPYQDHLPELFQVFSLRRQYLQNSLTWINTLIVPSHFLKEELHKHGFLHPNILHVPLGIHPFKPLSHKPLSGIVNLTFLGNINFTKGLDVMIQAFNLLRTDKARLNIYGKVQDENYFRQVMSINMKPQLVKYHGPYSPEDLPVILSETDIAVIPSRSENYPFVVRECLHAGVPVIASKVGGIPEIINNGVNGFLFKSGDCRDLSGKILLLMQNTRMVETFRNNIQPIKTIAEDAEHLVQIYRAILARK